MRPVHEPITDRVGDGLVPDDGVPVLGVKLTGDDRGPEAVPILQDLEKDLAFGRAEGLESEVVELCGAPHNSTNGERPVMWSVRRKRR